MHENDTILRLLTMLRLLPRRPRCIETAEIERKLHDEGFHVTRRTIQWDLHRLSQTFPLTSDDHRPTGWSWVQDGAILDLPGIAPSTALTFVLVESFLAPLLPRTALRKLQPYLKPARKVLDSIPGNNLRGWPAKVRVIHRGPPLQLPDIKQLALHRIRQVEVLQTPSAVPEAFELDRYIQEGEFMYLVGEQIRLEAIFDRGAAFHLHETPLSVDQTITDLDAARVAVQATVQDTAELRWWLMGFGAQVEVVAPEILREEFREMALAMAAFYRAAKSVKKTRDTGRASKRG